MSMYDDDDDDVVVDREGGYYGGYNFAIANPLISYPYKLGQWVTTKFSPITYGHSYSNINMVVGILIICVLIYLFYFVIYGQVKMYSGMGNIIGSYDQSQPSLSTFVNNRDAPYFPDVTNDVLRREDMEAEAVRALAKINQERVRRATPSDTAPLEWGPFWDEWRQTHGATDYSSLANEGMSNSALDKAGLGL